METDEGGNTDSGGEAGLEPVDVTVVGVYEHPKGAFVLLRDRRGRAMPIFIGHPEALSISLALDRQTTPRPLTHDLFVTAVRELGATAKVVVINRLEENTYYAVLVLEQGEGALALDCRPSDAIALALRFGIAVRVTDSVLEEAQIDWRQDDTTS